MKAHDLARLLLAGPDLPVVISTGSVEDKPEEIEGVVDQCKENEHTFYNRNLYPMSVEHIRLR